ncbi:hypothetical protein [Nocardia abscessus]|nr:hypothetical protein [Nocardia abscessus]
MLREAGRHPARRRYSPERRSQDRVDDLEARFPGLLDLVRV